MALAWKTQHFRKQNWTEQYFSGWDKPSRRYLVSLLKEESFESLLEVGCNSGPNLKAIVEAGISAKLHGVDINEHAIAYGSEQFKRMGVNDRVLLESKNLCDNSGFPPLTGYDVVIAIAVLMHIPEDGLGTVLDHVFHVAKKRILLFDLHKFRQFDGRIRGIAKKYNKDRWLRDWWSELSRFSRNIASVRIGELPPSMNLAHISDINAVIDIRLSLTSL